MKRTRGGPGSETSSSTELEGGKATESMIRLRLHQGRERRVLQGHRWVFANEIADRFADCEPGSWVEVLSDKGVSLGSGYINPHSLIAVRIVCPPGRKPDREFFHHLITDARTRREIIYPGSECWRAVFGESDGLPGLVADRYGDVLVCQITTLGMARMEPLIREVLVDVYKPRAMVFRNDTTVRTLEGLPLEKDVAFGNLPDPLRVKTDGLEFRLDPLNGQKTGLYLDQRDNRNAFRRWAGGRRVLDLFCYNGAWSLAALSGGAIETVGVDQSPDAIDQARDNAARNGMEDRCSFLEGDVFHHLRSVEKGAFDVIILDPPAFAKTRNSLPDARKGYTDLNRRALLALKPGGMLVSCSCSHHLNEEMFRETLLNAARAAGRRLRLVEARGQAADHPVLLAMPETRYLKCWFLEVV